MNKFPVQATDPEGNPFRGEVEASSQSEALDLLAKEGYQDIQILPDGIAWARVKWEVQDTLRALDFQRLAKFLACLLALSLLAGLVVERLGRRTLVVEGAYKIESRQRVRARPTLAFFIDNRKILPNPKRTRIRRGRYRAELSFWQLRPPQRVRVRIRLKGFQEVSHPTISIPKTGQAVRLPELRLKRTALPSKK